MNQNDKIPGAVIRRERLARGIEQKALCRGICVPSYLSKLERGAVVPNGEILKALFDRLALPALDAPSLGRAEALIEEGYRRTLYGLDAAEILAGIGALGERAVACSAFAADWLILRGYRGENILAELRAMEGCLTDAQRRRVTVLGWRLGGDVDPRQLRSACLELGDSLALNDWAGACFQAADYGTILHLEDRVTAQALEEGNTFQLAEYYIIKGSAYSCLFLEDMMMPCYRRAINLLQNTDWRDRLDVLYYNIGATMLNFGRFDEADRYLSLSAGMADDPLLLHKRALLSIRRGDVARGREYLAAMAGRLQDAGEADRLRIEEAEWECRPGFLKEREYLALLDRLLAALARDYHFGHISFYQDVYLAACRQQRQYRKALAFQSEISKRSVKIIG